MHDQRRSSCRSSKDICSLHSSSTEQSWLQISLSLRSCTGSLVLAVLFIVPLEHGYGGGGRLICAVKEGSYMAVTGVSNRELASECFPNIDQHQILVFGLSIWRRSQMKTDEL
ncbi:hypothetical protein Tco_1175928 [Tanacetum coccineum]